VSIGFLVTYLSAFFDFQNSRDLEEGQQKALIQLLEDKLSAQAYKNANYTENMAKILIRCKN
jgi:hypothetical protein